VTAQLAQLAARAAITLESEERADRRDRLADDYHDLLASVLWTLEELGVPLPDPNSRETAEAAWV
jgi:signal transduction histidine kinase